MTKFKYHNGDHKATGGIFVFGSNLSGRHGAGSALYATHYAGALYGVGSGHTGNAYALPTKDRAIKALPLTEIEKNVTLFIRAAAERPNDKYFVTRVGCGLAGYKDEQIAPLFRGAPTNCIFPYQWADFLEGQQ